MERFLLRSGVGPRLALASALLIVSSLLWLVAVLLNFLGPAGPLTAGVSAWAAMGLDLPGAFLLATIYASLGRRGRGAARARRKWIAWGVLLWCGLTAYWRFVLPAVAQTNLQDLFDGLLGGYPAGLSLAKGSATVVLELFGLWIAASIVYAAVHALIAWDFREAGDDEWVRGLPAYAWLLGAIVSLGGTAAVVVGLLPVLRGGPIGPIFTTGAILKLLVAPNLFLSGYVTSLQLGRAIRREERLVLPTA